MMWHDILLEGNPSEEELQKALADAFGLARYDVQVVPQILSADQGRSVIAETRHLGGEFPLLVSIYVTPDLADRGVTPVVQRLAKLLDTRALMSDELNNPYAMRLVVADGEMRDVSLEANSLDDLGQYKLRVK